MFPAYPLGGTGVPKLWCYGVPGAWGGWPGTVQGGIGGISRVPAHGSGCEGAFAKRATLGAAERKKEMTESL